MQTEIRPFQLSDETVVVQLWKDCNLIVPWNDPLRDIRRKLRVQPELFLVGFISGELAATVMAGYEGHRGWLNYLAVAPRFRRQGLGRKMAAEAEARLRQMGIQHLPAIMINGTLKFSSIIPTNQELISEIEKYL